GQPAAAIHDRRGGRRSPARSSADVPRGEPARDARPPPHAGPGAGSPHRPRGAARSRLLGDLLASLGASLPEMRAGRGTLAQELRLIEAYLAVQQVRMGPRLHVALDVPPALAHAEVPPLVLLTLVENAIKHGLDP